jgi:chitinase
MPPSRPILTAYAIDDTLPGIGSDDARMLTHLNIAFGLVENGKVSVDHLKHLGCLQAIRSHNPELRILLSIGGWGAGGFSEAAGSQEGRAMFVRSALDLVVRHGLDGLDLDWEYPCYGQGGIVSSPSDKRNFSLLIEDLRNELDLLGDAHGCRYLLTIAAGADQYYLDGTEMARVQQALDWVQLMTYDMRGGFQTLTGHHTNLYTPTGDLFRISLDASVRMFVEAGVPREKLVVGAAFYARRWTDAPSRNHGLHQMTVSFGTYGPPHDELVEACIGKNGFVRHWDDEAKAAWLFDGSTFISYDDEESLRHKCRYIAERKLAGIMFWELGHDRKRILLGALHHELGSINQVS